MLPGAAPRAGPGRPRRPPATRITVEGHHDFAVLERRLAARIRAARAGDPAGALAPVAILAPTRLLLAHLQVRLAREFPGLLNVHFLHHDALARAAADAAGADLPRILPDRVLNAVVAGLLRAGADPLAAYVREHPGAAASLRRTLADLREAGIDPGAAARVGGLGERDRDLLRLYAGYAERLDRLAASGVADRAGFLRAALAHLPAFGRRFRLVVHYGAYELIGLNLALLRAVAAAAVPVVCLVPHHPTSPAYGYAGRFWRDVLGHDPEPLPDDPDSDRLLGNRLPALYDETAAAGGPLPDPPPAFHAQGPAAELRETALRILAEHAAHGTRLADIAVVARSLEPYAPVIGPVFDEHGLPFLTHAALDARRAPYAQAALWLARAGLRGWERQPLFDLLRSGVARVAGRDPSTEAHGWDRLARRWHVTGGLDSWTRRLPEWVGAWTPYLPEDADDETRARAAATRDRRARQARDLAAAVRALDRTLRPVRRAAGWTAWSEGFAAACRAVLSGFEDRPAAGAPALAGAPTPAGAPAPVRAPAPAGAATVFQILAEMRDLEAAGVRFDSASALAYFETALAETAVVVTPAGAAAAGGAAAGGVRVLDAMQARGLSFDAVFLVGLNADLFPRRPREDPFLGDAARRRLREAFGAPLPVGADAADEERLLLAHLLGSARRRLTVSWQRADARGRARVASPALREVARLAHGAADARLLTGTAARIAGHPGLAASEALLAHGRLPPAEARLGAVLQAGPAQDLPEIVRRLPPDPACDEGALRAGLETLRLIESFAPERLDHDACVGGTRTFRGVWTPSRIERLGTCPQRFFFEDVLGAAEMERVPEAYELEPAEIGSRVHEVLHDLYRPLAAGGPDASRARAGLAERLPAVWRTRMADLADRLQADYPVFWRAVETRWLAAIDRFVRDDLERLAADEAAILGLEEEVAGTLAPGRGPAVELRGRLDRVVRRADGALVVADYKTAGDLEARTAITPALKGLHLQLPLYVHLARTRAAAWGAEGAPIEAELLGVGPDFAAAEGGSSAARRPLDLRLLADHGEAFRETVRVLLDLSRAGLFPLHDGPWCDYCPYTRACRRTHVPTVRRLAGAPGLRDYHSLALKSSRRPLLADLAGAPEESS
jgi:hypothetical protein